MIVYEDLLIIAFFKLFGSILVSSTFGNYSCSADSVQAFYMGSSSFLLFSNCFLFGWLMELIVKISLSRLDLGFYQAFLSHCITAVL